MTDVMVEAVDVIKDFKISRGLFRGKETLRAVDKSFSQDSAEKLLQLLESLVAERQPSQKLFSGYLTKMVER